MPFLHFKGKYLVENHHLSVPFHELVPVRSKGLSKKASLHDNLIIQGDNLAALKALMPTYHGKVKCIYIDPPYNTGNEGWAYNDKVNSPMMRDWLGKVVDSDDLTRHDKWCCMMWPRLQLLRELLAEDGVIFVSIDDNEAHRLRMLMDEIFGEDNFRNEISVRRYDKNISRQFIDKGMKSLAVGYERVLAYAKSDKTLFNPIYRPAKEERQKKGYWKGFWNAADRPTMRYNLLGVKPTQGQWKWKESEAIKAVKNYQEYQSSNDNISLETYWRKTGKTKNFIRRREELTKGKNKGVEHWVAPSEGVLLSSNWEDVLASENLANIGIDFDSPKRVDLIKRLVMMATENNSVVLDSFAGSGTTAHAVLAQNKEDGGNRRFILVECEDYVDSLTAKRVRRVAKGIPSAKDEALKTGLGGAFSYFKLGSPLRQRSILDGSRMPSYEELAAYVFFTATGEEFEPEKIRKDKWFIGKSRSYDVFLIYEPDINAIKELALSSETARKLPRGKRKKLVFAPSKYLSREVLHKHRIAFLQLPFQIYEPFRA